jgi:perosamine synthetase
VRIGRTVPPAAAPIHLADFWAGLTGLLEPSRAFEERTAEFCEYLGVRHAFFISSGTAALTATLGALTYRSTRTEVIIPAYTCFSVPAAVLKAGLRPVLCDVNPTTFDLDFPLLEGLLSNRTLCVLAQHPFGIVSNVSRIRSLCREHGVLVVEDAAQAMGIQSSRGIIGALGDVGIYSLGRGKNITCGSGGIVVTSNDRIAKALAHTWRRLDAPSTLDDLKHMATLAAMSVLVNPRLYWVPSALPFLQLGQTIFPKHIALKRLSALQLGFLRSWRARLDQANRVRSEAVSYFDRHLRLTGRPTAPHCRLPILVSSQDERDRLHAESKRLGLGLGVGYPSPIHRVPEICHLFEGQQFPGAERIVDCLLTLPTHHLLSDRDKAALVECVASSPGVRRPAHGWRKAS